MEKKRVVSKFKQVRSAGTRLKIVEAAEGCFCRHGYFGASIQMLAAAADVSVGSFYFYFANKDELFLEVYRRQSERVVRTVAGALGRTDEYEKDRKAWLRGFIRDLLGTYGDSGKLRADLKALNYENPELALQKKQIKMRTAAQMMEAVEQSRMRRDMRVRHPQIALLLLIDLVDVTYERISDKDEAYGEEDVVEECLDAVYKYILL